MNNKKIIIGQAIFLIIILVAIYFIYPKTNFALEGNLIRFNSINANVVIISENPDFSNPRYIDLKENMGNFSASLKPGTYYWKASNSFIQGLTKKFVIKSEVGMEIERENESELVNIGNVKLNVTKTEEGYFVGHIVLEPGEKEAIEDKNESYTGRQE